jgi:exodeoxyribonuclease VII small subunit
VTENQKSEKQKSETEGPGFDQALVRLQQLVKSLEAGDLSLEDSLKAFEEGVRLSRSCQAHLSAAEQKVEQLVKAGDDKTAPEMAPFSGDKQ